MRRSTTSGVIEAARAVNRRRLGAVLGAELICAVLLVGGSETVPAGPAIAVSSASRVILNVRVREPPLVNFIDAGVKMAPAIVGVIVMEPSGGAVLVLAVTELDVRPAERRGTSPIVMTDFFVQTCPLPQ